MWRLQPFIFLEIWQRWAIFFKKNLSVQESDPFLLDAKWQNSSTEEILAFSHFRQTYFSVNLFVIFYELSGQEGTRPTDHILHPSSK
jgi:hypothetical protein